MDNGFLRLDRAIFCAPAWRSARTFSGFEAFLDLLRRANWRTKQFRVQDRWIELQPGDLIVTPAKLGEVWSWPPDEVERWLHELADGHVLTGKRFDTYLKISLDPHCIAHFVTLPDPSRARKDILLSSPSSEERKEETSSESSSVSSSDTLAPEEEQKLEQKTKEDILYSAHSEEEETEDLTHPRACATGDIVDRIMDSLAKPKPTGDLHTHYALRENSERVAELRESCPTFLHRETEFPPDFPMDDFRRYVDAALLNPDRRSRPQPHRGWMAELRDRFLAERAAPKETGATETSHPEEKQAA